MNVVLNSGIKDKNDIKLIFGASWLYRVSVLFFESSAWFSQSKFMFFKDPFVVQHVAVVSIEGHHCNGQIAPEAGTHQRAARAKSKG